jgi:transcriptional regulator with XRE-family HTH domain
VVNGNRTIAEQERHLGDQVRRARIAQSLDQESLSALSNVSLATLSNLENGRGSSLKTLLKVVQALGRSDWLDGLAPRVQVSPLAALRQARRGEALTPRRRVRMGSDRSNRLPRAPS